MEQVKKNLPLSSPNLLEIRNYWVKLRGDQPLPKRRDFSPASIVRYLPYVGLVDVFEDPLRFRYRLIGTKITELAGRNATGKWLDEELYGEKTEDMVWPFRRCAVDSSPIATREEVQFVDKTWIDIDIAIFPLSDAEGKVVVLLSAVDFSGPDAERPPPGVRYVLNWELG